MNRKKTLKLSNMKHSKLAVHFFFEKVISKNETIVMFLEIHTYHDKQIKKSYNQEFEFFNCHCFSEEGLHEKFISEFKNRLELYVIIYT
jgi:hypothetical protein